MVRTFLKRVANPVVTFVLRSPFHGLISRSTMLITVTGRRTGRRYTAPIGYRLDGKTVMVVTSRHRSWWRNLEGGAAATLRIRGRNVQATGEPLPINEAAIVGELRAQYPLLAGRRAERMAEARLLVRLRPVARPPK